MSVLPPSRPEEHARKDHLWGTYLFVWNRPPKVWCGGVSPSSVLAAMTSPTFHENTFPIVSPAATRSWLSEYAMQIFLGKRGTAANNDRPRRQRVADRTE